jgi:hypothetical protein
MNRTTDLTSNATGGFGRINNVTSWHHCDACDDRGLAEFTAGAAPCPLCAEGERWVALWLAQPRRYGPPVTLPLEALLSGSVE